jgi:hypothetical protein
MEKPKEDWNLEAARSRLADWARPRIISAAETAQARAHLSTEYHAQRAAAPWDRWFVKVWFWFLRLFRRKPVAAPPIRITMGANHDGGSIILRGLDESGQPIEERVDLPVAGTATSGQTFSYIGNHTPPCPGECERAEVLSDIAELEGLRQKAVGRANRLHRRAQRAEGLLAQEMYRRDMQAVEVYGITKGLAFDVKPRPDEEGYYWFRPEGWESWEPCSVETVEGVWMVTRLHHDRARLDALRGDFIGPCEITVTR